MSTLTTGITLVCIVVHQVGVIRNQPSVTIPPNSVIFPCYLNDDEALVYYNLKMTEQMREFCPDCMR